MQAAQRCHYNYWNASVPDLGITPAHEHAADEAWSGSETSAVEMYCIA